MHKCSVNTVGVISKLLAPHLIACRTWNTLRGKFCNVTGFQASYVGVKTPKRPGRVKCGQYGPTFFYAYKLG